jgi:hypothetical protein
MEQAAEQQIEFGVAERRGLAGWAWPWWSGAAAREKPEWRSSARLEWSERSPEAQRRLPQWNLARRRVVTGWRQQGLQWRMEWTTATTRNVGRWGWTSGRRLAVGVVEACSGVTEVGRGRTVACDRDLHGGEAVCRCRSFVRGRWPAACTRM